MCPFVCLAKSEKDDPGLLLLDVVERGLEQERIENKVGPEAPWCPRIRSRSSLGGAKILSSNFVSQAGQTGSRLRFAV